MDKSWGLGPSQALLPLLRQGVKGLPQALEQVGRALRAHRAYLFRLEERQGIW